jgi:hypothetical protein
MLDVWTLALNDPKTYSTHLTNHHAEVAAFGGMFLLLVFLNFLLDSRRKRTGSVTSRRSSARWARSPRCR